ncbi:MAG: hypothetical protein IPO88_25755 [Nannocystis sp.]|uniref:hypothetical protein n=1 Tax=Nannocystis sp. TaxID=1962667 RepID=UPI002423F6D7|nr:hypothetical protein [Nannocystis sp.]MBK9756842.1 hypothetical protein [Nannocystis sp.]
MAELAATHGEGLGRLVVVNWAPEAIGLVRALQGLGAASLVLIGTHAAAAVEASLVAARTRGSVEYLAASVGDGVEVFAEFLGRAASVATAGSVIVLPHRGRGETDAFSRLTCTAIHRACRGQPPRIVVAVEDPEATHEFAGLGVTTIFYPGFLRAALLAHACLDLGVLRFMLALLRGGLRVQSWPLPPELRERSFRDACLAVETDPEGRPVTLLGLFDAEQTMVVNPGPGRSLAGATGLLVLTGQDT